MLLALLLSVNILFLLCITTRSAIAHGNMYEQVKSEKEQKKATIIISHYLNQYILLKLEIQKQIRSQAEPGVIIPRTSLAVEKLESVLSMENLQTYLGASKCRDIEHELNDMKRTRQSLLNKLNNQ